MQLLYQWEQLILFFYVIRVENYIYYATAFAVFLVIWLPFGLRHRKAMIRFVSSTSKGGHPKQLKRKQQGHT